MLTAVETPLAALPFEMSKTFRGEARYFRAMDFILYLKEDVSYRAARLSAAVTVLLHPTEDRAVGVKIKGVRHLIERLRALVEAMDAKPMSDEQAVRLIAVLEVAFTSSWGDEIVADAEAARNRRLAEQARELAGNATIAWSELPLAA